MIFSQKQDPRSFVLIQLDAIMRGKRTEKKKCQSSKERNGQVSKSPSSSHSSPTEAGNRRKESMWHPCFVYKQSNVGVSLFHRHNEYKIL
jgi:hypothetical protein